jgi:hypothetical protein
MKLGKVSEWVRANFADQSSRLSPDMQSVLSLLLAEVDDIVESPERSDFGNETLLRRRDDFHQLVFGHNGPQDEVWEGLRCNRFYLNSQEYQFIVRCHQLHHFRSVVESGSGESSRLFARLGCKVLSIEWQNGRWVDRATEGGATVKLVGFDEATGEFDRGQLETALRGQTCDLLFVDSPVGTRNRARVLDSFYPILKPRYVLIHDAHRDVQNVYRWMQAFGLKVLEYFPSWRGLILLEKTS